MLPHHQSKYRILPGVCIIICIEYIHTEILLRIIWYRSSQVAGWGSVELRNVKVVGGSNSMANSALPSMLTFLWDIIVSKINQVLVCMYITSRKCDGSLLYNSFVIVAFVLAWCCISRESSPRYKHPFLNSHCHTLQCAVQFAKLWGCAYYDLWYCTNIRDSIPRLLILPSSVYILYIHDYNLAVDYGACSKSKLDLRACRYCSWLGLSNRGGEHGSLTQRHSWRVNI